MLSEKSASSSPLFDEEWNDELERALRAERFALLTEAERAISRLNPPLLISGPVVGKTADTKATCLCAYGAMIVARRGGKGRIAARRFRDLTDEGGGTPWVGDLVLASEDGVGDLVLASEAFRDGDNSERDCRARHKYVLRWLRAQIRACAK